MQESSQEGGAHIPDNMLSGEILQQLDYDCILHIISFINDGATYKSALFLNMFVHEQLTIERGIEHRKNIDRFSDHLSTLVAMYPGLPWEWRWIAPHALPLSVIQKNWDELLPHAIHLNIENVPLNFIIANDIWSAQVIKKFGRLLLPYVSRMPRAADKHVCRYILTEEDIALGNLPNIPNIFQLLSDSPNISSIFIFLNKDKYLWHWDKVAYREDLTEEQIQTNMILLDPSILARHYPIYQYGFDDSHINYNAVASQKYCTIEDIKNFAHKITNWYPASTNPAISYKDIQDNLQLPWELHVVTVRSDVPFEEAMRIFPFDSDEYSIHDLCQLCSKPDSDVDRVFALIGDYKRVEVAEELGSVTISLIRKYPCLEDAYIRVPIDDVMANLDIRWDWEILSDTVTIEDIKKYPQLIDLLDWSLVSLLDTITPEEVVENPDLPWEDPVIDSTHYLCLRWTHFSDHFEEYERMINRS